MSMALHIQALERRCKDVESDNLELIDKLASCETSLAESQNDAARLTAQCADIMRELEVAKIEVVYKARQVEVAISDAKLWRAEALRLKLELEHAKLHLNNP